MVSNTEAQLFLEKLLDISSRSHCLSNYEWDKLSTTSLKIYYLL